MEDNGLYEAEQPQRREVPPKYELFKDLIELKSLGLGARLLWSILDLALTTCVILGNKNLSAPQFPIYKMGIVAVPAA